MQHPLQAIGQRGRLHLVFQIGHQDREFVAAQARYQIALPHVFEDAARYLHQELVAGTVAQAVVDDLEAIEIEEHHSEVMPCPAMAALDGLLEALVEAAALGRSVKPS